MAWPARTRELAGSNRHPQIPRPPVLTSDFRWRRSALQSWYVPTRFPSGGPEAFAVGNDRGSGTAREESTQRQSLGELWRSQRRSLEFQWVAEKNSTANVCLPSTLGVQCRRRSRPAFADPAAAQRVGKSPRSVQPLLQRAVMGSADMASSVREGGAASRSPHVPLTPA